jgi:hypothetical protein
MGHGPKLFPGGNPDNIILGSSLSEDGFQGEKFEKRIEQRTVRKKSFQ